ncbi:ATP-binding protein [Actinomadura macra]|uniref:ATP-binding protein n=1 Tax=Actinomadura macra TaxID=46164 RepID=UPI001FDFEA86|nr:hypothetical protein [Actinomadura macra]
MGKTRLALAAADQASAAFRDGVAILEVGDLPPERKAPDCSLNELWHAVQTAIGPAPESTGKDDRRMLLVIDNAEHVTETLTELARPLLAGCPGLSLVVTSRRPISAPFACSWEVTPLAVTGDERPDAVELFLRRARSACPTLDLTGQLGPIRRLCERLDGIPFAIELAAMRLRSISLARLLRDETISQIIDQTRPTGLPHQRTLTNSVEWSYDLLEEESRAVLHRLAALSGVFTIEDAESVCDRGDAPIPDLVGRLSTLVDSSLVQVQRGPRYSYRLLGYVREIVTMVGERPSPNGRTGTSMRRTPWIDRALTHDCR